MTSHQRDYIYGYVHNQLSSVSSSPLWSESPSLGGSTGNVDNGGGGVDELGMSSDRLAVSLRSSLLAMRPLMKTTSGQGQLMPPTSFALRGNIPSRTLSSLLHPGPSLPPIPPPLPLRPSISEDTVSDHPSEGLLDPQLIVHLRDNAQRSFASLRDYLVGTWGCVVLCVMLTWIFSQLV